MKGYTCFKLHMWKRCCIHCFQGPLRWCWWDRKVVWSKEPCRTGSRWSVQGRPQPLPTHNEIIYTVLNCWLDNYKYYCDILLTLELLGGFGRYMYALMRNIQVSFPLVPVVIYMQSSRDGTWGRDSGWTTGPWHPPQLTWAPWITRHGWWGKWTAADAKQHWFTWPVMSIESLLKPRKGWLDNIAWAAEEVWLCYWVDSRCWVAWIGCWLEIIDGTSWDGVKTGGIGWGGVKTDGIGWDGKGKECWEGRGKEGEGLEGKASVPDVDCRWLNRHCMRAISAGVISGLLVLFIKER